MRHLLVWLAVTALLVTSWSVREPFVDMAHQHWRLCTADAVVYGDVIQSRSYAVTSSNAILTDVTVRVRAANGLPPDSVITITRRGGTVHDPKTGLTRQSIVDTAPVPDEGEVFLVLRLDGAEFTVIESAALSNGRPLQPLGSAYLKRLNQLRSM